MKEVFSILGNLTLLLVSVTLLACQPRTVKYDCGMAEWHPDIPKQVKEECRNRYKKAT